MTALPASVFSVDGERLVPTQLARGPWSPHHQHGGAPAALVARAVERCDAEHPMHVVRLTVDLVRPVPLEPLVVSARVARPGRKVQLVEVSIEAGGVQVVRATALRIRTAPVTVAVRDEPDDRLEVGPEGGDAVRHEKPSELHFGMAMDMVAADGAMDASGPATVWFRLAVPVVAGEEPSPLQRVAAAADFGNGISGVVDWSTHLFINPDLTVYPERPAEGEWVGVAARTRVHGDGVGLAEGVLFDRRGRVGRSVQGLLFETR